MPQLQKVHSKTSTPQKSKPFATTIPQFRKPLYSQYLMMRLEKKPVPVLWLSKGKILKKQLREQYTTS
jgi:hypothetical protein